MALFAATVMIRVRALREWRLCMCMLDLPAADPEHTTQAAVEKRETDCDDEQSGNDAQPGVEGLRHDVAREVECHRSEGEDPDSVSQRHRQSEKSCVAGCSPGSNKVSCDNGLAVAGSQGVRRTPEESDQHRYHDDG